MDAQAIHTEVGRNPEAIPSAKDRWGTDSVGRIYYPFGPAFRGYRVLDAAAEAQIRAADEQYERSGLRFVRSVSSASTIGLLFLLGLIFELHPVLAVTFFFVAIIIIVGATAVFRFRAVRSCLLGLAATPANSDSRQRLIETLGMAVSTVFVFWAALVLYDVRLTALIPDHPGELRFYPTIAGNLVFVAMGLPFLFTAIVHFDHLASKIGQNQTTLALVLFSLLQVAALAIIVSKFVAPTPRIIVAERSLACGWKHNWREMTGVDLGDDRKGREYAVVGLQPPVVRALGISSERCRIDGLSVDYKQVYGAIVSAWQPHANDP